MLDLINNLLATYATIATDAKAYLQAIEKDKEAGLVAMVANQWLVVLDETGYGMALHTENTGPGTRQIGFKGVKGDLIGVSQYTREGAAKVIEFWRQYGIDSLQHVKMVRNIDVVRARLADAEAQTAMLKDRQTEIMAGAFPAASA